MFLYFSYFYYGIWRTWEDFIFSVNKSINYVIFPQEVNFMEESENFSAQNNRNSKHFQCYNFYFLVDEKFRANRSRKKMKKITLWIVEIKISHRSVLFLESKNDFKLSFFLFSSAEFKHISCWAYFFYY
jgi:hypothetical protein